MLIAYSRNGNVEIVVPGPKKQVLVSEAEYRDEIDTQEVETGLIDEQGNPTYRTVETGRRKMLVKEAVYRMETDAEHMARVKAKCVPADATDIEEVEPGSVPQDRTFRNAWAKSPGRVDVDMPKAREIHMGRIRKVRNAKLDELDREEKAAEGTGNTSKLTEVRSLKQTLRNIPQTIDLGVSTPEELKAIWPEELA